MKDNIKKFYETVGKKVKDYSKEFGTTYRQVCFMLAPNESGKVDFNLFVNGALNKKLNLQTDVLEIKIDFMNIAAQVDYFLTFILNGFIQELGCEPKDVSVMIIATSDEDANPYIVLYKNNQFVRYVDLVKELDL